MALGDRSRVQNAIDYWGSLGQNNINNLRTNLTRQNQGLENRFNVAGDRAWDDYNNIMDRYGQMGDMFSSYLNGPGIRYNPSNQNFGAYSGYEDFSKTGGYSDQDVANIRARSLAPLRATYANAQTDLDRRNAIAGGNLANYAASKAKMSRELGYNLADSSQNVEGMLAEAIRSGKLAGLGGMTGIDTSRMSEGLANAAQNLQAQGMDSSRILGLLSGMGNVNQGMTSLYGATPGMANMYGNQMLRSSDQALGVEQLQQELMRAILSGQLSMSQLPSNFNQVLGNIGGVLGLGGQIGGMLPGLGGLFGASSRMPQFGTTYPRP